MAVLRVVGKHPEDLKNRRSFICSTVVQPGTKRGVIRDRDSAWVETDM